ncbi:MAG: exodeoxyribonuclease VII large subunit [Phycisphaerales bacterium]
MSRLPFDPSKMKGPKKAADAPTGDRPIPVSAVASMIDEALATGLPKTVTVIGEISGFTDRTHLYFDLKDDGAVLSCVMFAAAAKKVPFRPASGQQVIAKGRVSFYPKQGRTQLYVESMTPAGEGPLELELRRLVAELRELGYFDPARKKPLPTFPRRVAVVTSATGAALQDVRETFRKRMPAIELVLVDVRVQGDNAAPQIARAIRRLSRDRAALGIDAIILTRGGGSLEDLWAFNERPVADALLECAVPVVAAIGHETDTTIAELVADERASTPTQAAMRLSPDRLALLEQIDRRDRQLLRALNRFLSDKRDRAMSAEKWMRHAVRAAVSNRHLELERLSVRLARSRPEAAHARRRARIESLDREIRRSIAVYLDSHQSRLDALERELVVAGPASVLARGYSVTTRADGSAVRSSADVKPGETITTRVADGSFSSTVNDASRPTAPRREDAPAPPPRSRPKKRRPKRDADPDQMGLF